MIRFACPRCYKKMSADDSRAGQIGTCPDCYKRFRVPRSKSAAARTAKAGPPSDFGPEPAGGKVRDTTALPVTPSRAGPEPADDLEVLDGLELMEEEPAPPPPPPPRGAVAREPAPPREKPRVADDDDIPEVEAVEEVESAEDDERRPGPRRAGKKERRGATSGVRVVLFVGIGVAVLLAVCGGGGAFVLYTARQAVTSATDQPPPGLAVKAGPGAQPQPEPQPPPQPPPRPPPAPPAPRDPQAVDAECARLLRGPKKEARAWMGEPGAMRYPDTMELARYAEAAYRHGAKTVHVVDLTPDEDGDVFPRLVVVLPDDQAVRGLVFAWYRPLRPDAKDAGQKYLLVAPKE